MREISKMANSKSRLVLLFLLLAVLLGSVACGPPSGDWSGTSRDEIPELTEDDINDRINETRVYDVKPADGQGDSISWGFDEDEPKTITVVERSVEGKNATVILDITTRSAPRARDPRELTGRLKTYWQYETGFAARRWEIQHSENMTMTYKKLPKPADQNSNVALDSQGLPQPGGNSNLPPPPPLPR